MFIDISCALLVWYIYRYIWHTNKKFVATYLYFNFLFHAMCIAHNNKNGCVVKPMKWMVWVCVLIGMCSEVCNIGLFPLSSTTSQPHSCNHTLFFLYASNLWLLLIVAVWKAKTFDFIIMRLCHVDVLCWQNGSDWIEIFRSKLFRPGPPYVTVCS